jgi:CRISPR-associated protein Csb3
MKNPEPSIRVNVDPTNPGQFFACCGLLELADQLWEGAEGRFEGRDFLLAAIRPTGDTCSERLMSSLLGCRLSNTMSQRQLARLEELSAMKAKEREKASALEGEKKVLERLRRELPIVLQEPFRLQIDWFLDDYSGGSRFKTWAGQQSVLDIASAMQKALIDGRWGQLPSRCWLAEITHADDLPFNFDSDLGGQASAIDLGFSMDPLKMNSPTRPFIEFLAFIGLQRFRPLEQHGENRFTYVLWTELLPPSVASAACCGFVPQLDARAFQFRLLYRTKYLKSFLPAQPARGAR